MTHNLRRLALALMVSFGAVALMLAYWSMVGAAGLLAREDNPRRVEHELAIMRGQIVDHDENVLAQTITTGDGTLQRTYPHSNVSPVTGYYSFRYGTGGIEAAFDAELRGDAFLSNQDLLQNRWFHREQVGGDVRLTVNLELQQAAGLLLAPHSGAVVLVGVPSGDVLAMVSAPDYDPNQLDENWDALAASADAPLVNRVTQGLYQPGTALQTVLLGAALDRNLVALDTRMDSERPLTTTLGGVTLPCGLNSEVQIRSLQDAYAHACPAPFGGEGFAQTLGAANLQNALEDFGLGTVPLLRLPPDLVADSQLPAITATTLPDVALGHGDLKATPLQMVLVAAAVANDGQAPALRLADASRPAGGEWVVLDPAGHPRAAMSRDSAATLTGAMRSAVLSGAAHDAAQPGLEIYGHAGLALADDDTFNGWFIGFVPRGDSWLAIAVLVEDVPDTRLTARIGGEILAAAVEILQASP